MPPKRTNPLREQRGVAMILVLCLGALFVALAAALVYASSLMMANANRQLPEQDVYELAVSFSDVLEQELTGYTGAADDGTGTLKEPNDNSLGYFINHIYVKKGSINNPYGDDTDHTFTLDAPEGVDSLTVTLRKTAGDDSSEEGNLLETYSIAAGEDMAVLNQTLSSKETDYNERGIDDYDITVTVRVEKGGQSYAYTRQYRHTGFYQYYYTRDTSNTQLERSGAEGTTTLVMKNLATGETVNIPNSSASTLYLRYRMDADTACRFTRITSTNQ